MPTSISTEGATQSDTVNCAFSADAADAADYAAHMRRHVFAAGVLAGIAFVACGSAGQDTLRDMAAAVDLANVINVDGSAPDDALAFLDMSRADAQSGGTVLTAPCDQILVAGAVGSTIATRWHFAEFDVGKVINAATAPVVVTCDMESAKPWGNAGYYCDASIPNAICNGYVVPLPECTQGGWLRNGNKIVVTCGALTFDGDVIKTGQRFKTAAIYVPN